MAFKIKNGSLYMTKENGFAIPIGSWLPGNEEQILRLFARVYNEGRASRLLEIQIELGIKQR